MNKKGFTLIELLAVVLVLFLLIMFVIPSIVGSVNEYSKETDKLMIDMIKKAARLYIEDNPNTFNGNSYDYYCITVKELVDNNYLKDRIEIDGKDITDTQLLKIDYYERKVELVDECIYMQLESGLYDENDVLLASWDELVEKYDFENLIENGGSDGSTGMGYAALIIDINYKNARKLVISDSVTSIGETSFMKCTSLTSIMLQNSVTSIGDYAFEDCINLTNITIKNSVVDIGIDIFYGCTSLTTIYYSGTATGAPWGATNATVVSE